jgi:ribosome-binding protein aMBF1 (putative translation factor)
MLMGTHVAQPTTESQPSQLRKSLTTQLHARVSVRDMSDDIPTIHKSKQPRRPHYVREWAEKRGMRPVDLATELDVDKSLVTRWYQGSTPNEESLAKLGALFGVDPESMFRDPDEDWLARLLRGRDREEIKRIITTIETAFPRKAG